MAFFLSLDVSWLSKNIIFMCMITSIELRVVDKQHFEIN